MWEGGEEVPLIRLELNLWVIGPRCLRKLLLQAFAWDMISKWCFWECLVQSYLMDNPNSQKSTSLEKSFQTPKDPWQWFAAGSILAHHITPVEVDKMFITITIIFLKSNCVSAIIFGSKMLSENFWNQGVATGFLKLCRETASKLVPALPTLHTSIPHFVENQMNKDLLKSPRLACPLSRPWVL